MTPIWDDAVASTVAKMIGVDGFGECRAMSVIDKGGRFAAGVVFHNWAPENGTIEISAAAASPKWSTRDVLRFAFGYAFEDCDCQAVVARTHEDNTRARRLWKAIGADEYTIPRLRGRSASEAISVLTKEAWTASRFMK